ncbi:MULTISPECIES: hypothetical protein [Snodgrassella]|uniref:hypothetical protein n=1 Tax=Snodgrassella TaxID=1193515 RepID=UPI000815BED7|nr:MULTISPECIES: hypothetical protein [Snodgrassella]SCB92856.1 hypothetical protein GA0061082_1042 [Snodgrassella sp. R-53583]
MQYVETSQNDKYQIAMLVFLVAFFTYICVYGFELTHFGLSIDEEFNNNISHTIANGISYLKPVEWQHLFKQQN